MTDFPNLVIDDVGDLVSALEDELGGVSTRWWNKNKGVVAGNLKSLATAAIKTQAALIEGRIDQETAELALAEQKASLQDVLNFTELMTLVLAQQLLDATFRLIGWVIYNKTGVNLAPDLVQPTAGTDISG
ncbi:hypothetical protein [Caulobacter sp.]|uniref:hypothetical protein n=1 Tax=Caulobacter sp. TaxID=78 RepID=UPI003BAE94E5